MEQGPTVIRWWVTHPINPINTDHYEVFIIDTMPDNDQRYFKDGDWHDFPFGGFAEPAIRLPGYLCAQMVATGREDISGITKELQTLAQEIWQTQRLRGQAEVDDDTDSVAQT